MSRLRPHRPYDYVAGEFPSGMKFRDELGNKEMQQLKDAGSKVIVMRADYQLPDLEDAREQCKQFTQSK